MGYSAITPKKYAIHQILTICFKVKPYIENIGF